MLWLGKMLNNLCSCHSLLNSIAPVYGYWENGTVLIRKQVSLWTDYLCISINLNIFVLTSTGISYWVYVIHHIIMLEFTIQRYQCCQSDIPVTCSWLVIGRNHCVCCPCLFRWFPQDNSFLGKTGTR